MIDLSKFEKLNVADTCSLWNLLASPMLYSTAESVGVRLCSTTFVRYECLHKPSRRAWPERDELQKRLRAKVEAGKIAFYGIAIEDLQDVEILKSRKKVSTGELSVIVFAKKTSQAVLTDDVGAQKLARTELDALLVQNTAQLFGWLYFNSHVGDSDKDKVKTDLLALCRTLKGLDEIHTEAQRCRALANIANRS